MKQKILDLIIAAKRTDPETGSFAEWLAEYLVANGVTVHEWIPVGERLPTKADGNEDGEVLAVWIGGRVQSPASLCCGGVCSQQWAFVAGHPEYFSHWSPLPEPPGKDVSGDG